MTHEDNAVKDSKTLAKEARKWVASEEGQRKIAEALQEAYKVTNELNKYQRQSVLWDPRIPFI